MNLQRPSGNHCSGATAAHASQPYAANRESDPDASHVIIDVETRSSLNLHDIGAHRYAACAETDVLVVGYAIGDEPVETWIPIVGEPIPEKLARAAVHENIPFVAHNGPFEIEIFRHILGPRFGFPVVPVERWVCTMVAAQVHAVPPAQPDDCYQTPAWVTRAVAPYLRERCRNVWEPANGPESKMARVLRDEGFNVIATDDDFLARTALPHADVDGIVTNPPGVGSRLAVRFIEHALALAPVVAMLLRVDFDSGKTRAHLFRDCPTFVQKLVLLDRIVWFAGDSGPSDNHAWYVWRRGHQGLPTIAYAQRNDDRDQQRVAPQPRSAISDILHGFVRAQQQFLQQQESGGRSQTIRRICSE